MSSIASARSVRRPGNHRLSFLRGNGVRAALTAMAVLAAVSLSACGEETKEADASQEASPSGTVTFDEGWVKAADSGMSAAFGDLNNGTDKDVTLVEVSSPVSKTIELHETIPQDDGSMAMQEKSGGFSVSANFHHHFAPGEDHLMLMGLSEPIKAGDEVPFTLTFDDGTTLEIMLVAKSFAGGDEKYHTHGDKSGDTGGDDTGEKDMGDMEMNEQDADDGS